MSKKARTFRKQNKKSRKTTFARGTKPEEPGSMTSWLQTLISSNDSKSRSSKSRHSKRRRMRGRHHRFCLKCITSSFRALFVYLGRPIVVLHGSESNENQNLTYFGEFLFNLFVKQGLQSEVCFCTVS
jgi:hypothetical protein